MTKDDSNPIEHLPIKSDQMFAALKALDQKLRQPVTLIIGGGGAMVMAYKFPLATYDIDAVPTGMNIQDLDLLVKEVAQENGLAPDWLNPYFSTFAHSLPSDYGTRLVQVLKGIHLTSKCLGKEDLLVMKCFAHRQKDIGHAKALIKIGADVDFVADHIESLQKKNIPGSKEAMKFLEDVQD